MREAGATHVAAMSPHTPLLTDPNRWQAPVANVGYAAHVRMCLPESIIQAESVDFRSDAGLKHDRAALELPGKRHRDGTALHIMSCPT